MDGGPRLGAPSLPGPRLSTPKSNAVGEIWGPHLLAKQLTAHASQDSSKLVKRLSSFSGTTQTDAPHCSLPHTHNFPKRALPETGVDWAERGVAWEGRLPTPQGWLPLGLSTHSSARPGTRAFLPAP